MNDILVESKIYTRTEKRSGMRWFSILFALSLFFKEKWGLRKLDGKDSGVDALAVGTRRSTSLAMDMFHASGLGHPLWRSFFWKRTAALLLNLDVHPN